MSPGEAATTARPRPSRVTAAASAAATTSPSASSVVVADAEPDRGVVRPCRRRPGRSAAGWRARCRARARRSPSGRACPAWPTLRVPGEPAHPRRRRRGLVQPGRLVDDDEPVRPRRRAGPRGRAAGPSAPRLRSRAGAGNADAPARRIARSGVGRVRVASLAGGARGQSASSSSRSGFLYGSGVAGVAAPGRSAATSASRLRRPRAARRRCWRRVREGVEEELQRRGQPDAGLLADLGAEDALGALQRGGGVRARGLVAEHRVEHRRRAGGRRSPGRR